MDLTKARKKPFQMVKVTHDKDLLLAMRRQKESTIQKPRDGQE